MVLVSRILLIAEQNLLVCSSDNMELIENRRSLQILLNREQTGNIRGAVRSVGS